MIIFGGTQHFWYLQVLLNFKDDHVWICVTTEIQFATDHCSGSGLCTVRGNLKFYIFGDNLQLWYLPMSNLIIFSPQISNGVFALIFFFTKVLSGICKTILCLNMYKMAEWSFVKNRYLLLCQQFKRWWIWLLWCWQMDELQVLTHLALRASCLSLGHT